MLQLKLYLNFPQSENTKLKVSIVWQYGNVLNVNTHRKESVNWRYVLQLSFELPFPIKPLLFPDCQEQMEERKENELNEEQEPKVGSFL